MIIDLKLFQGIHMRSLQVALEGHSGFEGYPIEECQRILWDDIKHNMREKLVPVRTFIQDGWPMMLCVSENDLLTKNKSPWLIAASYWDALSNRIFWSAVYSPNSYDFKYVIEDVKRQLSQINNGDMPTPSNTKDDRAIISSTHFEQYYAKEMLRIHEAQAIFNRTAKNVIEKVIGKNTK